MKKRIIIIISFVLIITILVIVILLNFNYFNLDIIDVQVEEYTLNPYADIQTYGIEVDKINNITSLKRVLVTCTFHNKSLKTITGAWVSFDPNQTLPAIVLGDKLDTDKVESINLSPFSSKTAVFDFLIDANGYKDDEIIDLVKDINLFMSSTDSPSLENGYSGVNRTIISDKPVKCQKSIK